MIIILLLILIVKRNLSLFSHSTFYIHHHVFSKHHTLLAVCVSHFNIKSFLKTLFISVSFSETICFGSPAGHYSHPFDFSCFVHCNNWGRAFVRKCSPGTLWKARSDWKNPSPSNLCVHEKKDKKNINTQLAYPRREAHS